MSVIHLSTHQADVLHELVAAHTDVQDIDVLEDDHGSIIVAGWAETDDDQAAATEVCPEDRLVFRVGVSIGGSVRDMTSVAA